jgi:membrane-bound lytic murein transglycosylase D
VKRALTRSRKTDFWQLTATKQYLPRETRDYVPMILAAVIIAKNPAQYGFDIEPMVPPATEIVAAPAALDLRRVAEWASVPVDDIQKLNPEYRRWTTPVKTGEYQIRVPQGSGDRVREGLAASAPSQLNALQWHTVKKGETLATIARKLRVNRTDLAEANYLKVNSRVKTGAKLLIPRMPSSALLARASSSDLETAAAATVEEILAETAALPADRIYRVRAGDTLSAIARRTGATVAQLKSWNKMRSTKLSIGARLIVQPPPAKNANQ